jgi:lysophospholipase L1-like esterase
LFPRLAFIAALLSSAAWASEFFVHDGDTVVFYGDSITNQRFYTVFTEAYILTRFPRMHVKFIHSGWSGDRVSGGAMGPIDVRLNRDVFAYTPTVITIMLGMNDGEYQPFDAAIFEKYTTGYRHILETIKAKAPQARVTVLEPSPYDDFTRPPVFEGGYNAVLERYGKFVRETGAAKNLAVANLNTPVVALLKAADAANPESARDLIPDRVHPSTGVHLVMAEALLRAWHAPSVVTSVEIDGSTGAVVRSENTKVDEMDALSWTQLDRSLPMPFETADDMIALAVRHSDFMEALNREMLRVTGLSAGRYRLQIDEETEGVFDAEQLDKGINLAAMKTPMSRQAQTVLDLSYRHNHLRFARMMMVENALKEFHPKNLQSTLDAMDALHEEIVAMQRAAALPKPHRYRITAVSGE